MRIIQKFELQKFKKWTSSHFRKKGPFAFSCYVSKKTLFLKKLLLKKVLYLHKKRYLSSKSPFYTFKTLFTKAYTSPKSFEAHILHSGNT